MTAEEWRPVPGFPSYDVSDLGRVRSWRSNGRGKRARQPKIMRPAVDRGGYLLLTLRNDETGRKGFSVHKLVLITFVGPYPPGMEARHLDGDSTNNVLSNLAYGTPSENQWDKLRHGTHHFAKRSHCKNGHEFTPENTWIRARKARSGGRITSGRVCRTCKADRARRYSQERAA